MAAFSLASWNVEHWTDGDDDRSRRVVDFLATQLPSVPDVFAILEVEGKDIYRHVMEKFPDHRFHQSEGKQLQEMLIGVHKRFQSFVTQRIEFQVNNDDLRPGTMVTIQNGTPYTMLFLHTKSGDDPYAYGLRNEMLDRCFALRAALDKAGGQPANFMFIGDLNTMGCMTYPFAPITKRVSEAEEIARLETMSSRRGMRLLKKDVPATFTNGPGKVTSDLDHVVAAAHMTFQPFGETSDRQVSVHGWPKEPLEAQGAWIRDYSDHGILYLRVQAT